MGASPRTSPGRLLRLRNSGTGRTCPSRGRHSQRLTQRNCADPGRHRSLDGRFGRKASTWAGSGLPRVRTVGLTYASGHNRQHRTDRGFSGSVRHAPHSLVVRTDNIVRVRPTTGPAYVPGQNRQHRTRGSSRCVRRTVSVRGKNRPRRTDRGSWGSVRPTARKVWPQIGRIVRIAPLGGPYGRPRVRFGTKSAASYGSRLLGVRTVDRAYGSDPNRPRRTDRAFWGSVRPAARTFRLQIGHVVRIAPLGGPCDRRVRFGTKSAASYGSRLSGVRTADRAYGSRASVRRAVC